MPLFSHCAYEVTYWVIMAVDVFFLHGRGQAPSHLLAGAFVSFDFFQGHRNVPAGVCSGGAVVGT